MNRLLMDLWNAYREIPEKYFQRAVQHKLGGEKVDKQDVERVVLGEFYHQWRCLMKDDFYKDLILHTEIGKRLVKGGSVLHPDLVLHRGQLDHSDDGNKVFVEFKISKIDEQDIWKCLYALSSHRYQFAVYIVHELSAEKFTEQLNHEQYPDKERYLDRFYFMNKELILQSAKSLLEKK